MVKVAIIYDSKTGNTEKMANAVAEGVKKAGGEVLMKKAVDASPEDLVPCDAIIWGAPSQYGLPSFPLKEFLDKTGQLWFQGKLINKVGAVFTTNATEHGGKEQGLMAMITPMLHHGMIIVGLPNNVPGNDRLGSYYGASATGTPDQTGLGLARALGERVVWVAEKMKGAPRQVRPQPAMV